MTRIGIQVEADDDQMKYVNTGEVDDVQQQAWRGVDTEALPEATLWPATHGEHIGEEEVRTFWSQPIVVIDV